MNSNGVIIFDYAHTTPVYTTTLMASAFNEEKQKNQCIAEKQKKKWWQKRKKKKKSVQEKQLYQLTQKAAGYFQDSKEYILHNMTLMVYIKLCFYYNLNRL